MQGLKLIHVSKRGYRSATECRSQWPLFSIPTESIPGCTFRANLVIAAQICDELSSNFLFWVKIAKMTLKVMGSDPHFQYQLKVSQEACLVQSTWFQPKSAMSYRAGKVYGQTVRRTDTGIDNTPERSRCSKMHYISMILVSKGSDYLIYTPGCGRTSLFISLLPLSLAHKLMIYL